MPTPMAAIAMRPPSSTFIACTNPSPRSPTRLPAGIRASSKISSAVSEACRPSLRYGRPALKPFVPRSTMKAEMPLALSPGAVRAMTTAIPPTLASVMKALLRFSTQTPPRCSPPLRSGATSRISSCSGVSSKSIASRGLLAGLGVLEEFDLAQPLLGVRLRIVGAELPAGLLRQHDVLAALLLDHRDPLVAISVLDGGPDVVVDEADDVLRRRARAEQLLDPDGLQPGHVLGRDDAAAEDDDVLGALPLEQLEHALDEIVFG